mmetsp:Transcript_49276/g.127090  ORF Transcript_49276/g.127090 Transcript_49276/m.127090 type:complete len:102 (-) Transcript_49276:58-363(-)
MPIRVRCCSQSTALQRVVVCNVDSGKRIERGEREEREREEALRYAIVWEDGYREGRGETDTEREMTLTLQLLLPFRPHVGQHVTISSEVPPLNNEENQMPV